MEKPRMIGRRSAVTSHNGNRAAVELADRVFYLQNAGFRCGAGLRLHPLRARPALGCDQPE